MSILDRPLKAFESFALTDGDKQSATWGRLKTHLERELTSFRAQNDNVELSECKTAAIRGKIAFAKALLNLDRDS